MTFNTISLMAILALAVIIVYNQINLIDCKSFRSSPQSASPTSDHLHLSPVNRRHERSACFKTDCPRCQSLPHRNITIAVLAPNDDSKPYSLNKVLPAISYAIESLQKMPQFRTVVNRGLSIIHRDTNCSSVRGPLHAVDIYYSGTADVFFGPLCDYVLAPVARFSTVWDIPILTASGQNDYLDRKIPDVKMLTRMNGSYTLIATVLMKIFNKFKWAKIGFLFHDYRSERKLGHSDCFFTLSPLAQRMAQGNYFVSEFDETLNDIDFYGHLRNMSKKARSK